jgi:hypothetical protein
VRMTLSRHRYWPIYATAATAVFVYVCAAVTCHGQRLRGKFETISIGVSFSEVNKILGEGTADFPKTASTYFSGDVSEPSDLNPTKRYCDDGSVVIELWFVEQRVAYRRLWIQTGPSLDERNLEEKLVMQSRMLWLKHWIFQ